MLSVELKIWEMKAYIGGKEDHIHYMEAGSFGNSWVLGGEGERWEGNKMRREPMIEEGKKLERAQKVG